MSVYFITYHMQSNSHHHHHEHGEECNCGGDPDYDLVCEIETLGKWAHFMPTSYLVHTSLNADEILERLSSKVGNKDLLFVSKIESKNMASLTPQVKEWIANVEG